MKYLICLIKGHVRSRYKKVFEDGVPIQIIEGFGGWFTSDGRQLCLRCGKSIKRKEEI